MMLRKVDRYSFGIGMGLAMLVGCALGAAANNVAGEHRYSIANLMGGLGMQIVDHQTNTVYGYKREKLEDSSVYVLYETIDLSQVGNETLTVKTHARD